LKHLIDLISFF